MRFVSGLRLVLLGLVAAPWLAPAAGAAIVLKLSTAADHPTANVSLGGSGFAPNEAIDIYFDTTDTLLVFTDGSGRFGARKFTVPADALPGPHWITAIGRRNGDGAQKPFVVGTEWSEFGFGERNRRTNPYENIVNASNAGSLDTAWIRQLGSSTDSCPAISRGSVYINVNDSNLYAISAATGAVRWTADDGGAAYACPAVANGVVYVGTGDGTLRAYNAATGAPKWTATTGSFIWASPTVTNSAVYAGTYDGKVYAFNTLDGSTLWTATTGDRIYSSPAVAGGTVYSGSFDGRLYAFDGATGATRWSVATGSNILASPAVAGGVIYIGSNDYKLYAFNSTTGALLWTATTASQVIGAPAVAGGIVYTSSDKLYAFDAASGATRWTADVYPGEASPLVANGVVYVTSYNDNKVHAFNADTGARLWSAVVGQVVYSSPSMTDGKLYVAAENGSLYAFALDGGANAVYRPRKRPSYAALHPDFHPKPAH